MRFAQSFPNFYGRRKLTWTHYRALLSVSDQRARFELADKADRLGWTSTELEEKIKRDFRRDPPSTEAPSPKKEVFSFKPKRGTLGAYRVTFSEVLLVDLGFSSFIEHPALKKSEYSDRNWDLTDRGRF